MTGKEFSQRPFSFPRGAKVKIKYTSIGKKNRDDVKESVCYFYGIKPIFSSCSANAEDFAPVFRAVAKNGKKNLLVCAECGSVDIQQDAWVDANTNEYCGDNGEDRDSHWCDNCGNDVRFTYMSEFEERMDKWARDKGLAWDKDASYESKQETYNKMRKADDE